MTKNKSFTLVELLIVILIIGVLAAVIVPKLAVIDKRAKERTTLANLKAIRKALELYKYDYPYNMPNTLNLLVPQYIQKIPPNLLHPMVASRTTWVNINVTGAAPGACDFVWITHPATFGWRYQYDNWGNWDHYHTAGAPPGYCQHGNRLVIMNYPGDLTQLDSDGTPYYEW